MFSLGLPELLLIVSSAIVYGLVLVLPLWKIVEKSGFHPAFSLLVFVPLLNFVMLYAFAFAEWPSLKRER